MIGQSGTEMVSELLTFFRALADTSRLRIVGLLACNPMTVERIAHILELRTSTVAHHLAVLEMANLAARRQEGYHPVYKLEREKLQAQARRLLTKDIPPTVTPDLHLDSNDYKIVRNFVTPEGSLRSIPARRKKLKAVLRYVVQAFEPRVRYSERQMNEILKRFHDDTARLRRELVDNAFMAREGKGGAYWRVDGSGAWVSDPTSDSIGYIRSALHHH